MPRSVLRGEQPPTATWTEQDGRLAQALTVYESSLCSGCGHPVAETMGEENTLAWESEVFRCHACTANADLADQMSQDKNRKHPEALRFAAKRIDPKAVRMWQKPGR